MGCMDDIDLYCGSDGSNCAVVVDDGTVNLLCSVHPGEDSDFTDLCFNFSQFDEECLCLFCWQELSFFASAATSGADFKSVKVFTWATGFALNDVILFLQTVFDLSTVELSCALSLITKGWWSALLDTLLVFSAGLGSWPTVVELPSRSVLRKTKTMQINTVYNKPYYNSSISRTGLSKSIPINRNEFLVGCVFSLVISTLYWELVVRTF